MRLCHQCLEVKRNSQIDPIGTICDDCLKIEEFQPVPHELLLRIKAVRDKANVNIDREFAEKKLN